jgi:hypothetical protein
MAKGLEVNIPVTIVATIGTVFVEILLLIANVITFKALDSGSAAFFGHRLASPHGYSLAVCGFQHASAVFKSSFCSDLSLNSSCRKLLGRIAIIWFILEGLKLVTPIGAIGLQKEPLRFDSGTISCVEYQEKNNPVDRRWPTLDAGMH